MDRREFSKGRIKGFKFGIGARKKDVEDMLKDQVKVGIDLHGFEYYEYDEFQFFYDKAEQIERIEVRPHNKFLADDVEQALGEPFDEGENPTSTSWMLVYKFGNYQVIFYFKSELDKVITYYKIGRVID